MRKRHLNSDSIAHNSLYHLQKGSDGKSIQITPLRRTDGGLRCNGMDYIKKGTPQKEGINILQEKRQRERAQHHSVNTSLLFINEKPILELA